MAAIMLQGAIQIAFVIAPLSILLPLNFNQAGGASYGAAVALEAAGAFIGATYGSTIKTDQLGLVTILALGSEVPEILSIAAHAPSYLILACCLVSGIGLSVFGVIWISQLQVTTPRNQLGRVLSLDSFSNSSLYPIGLILSGYAVSAFGSTTIAYVAATILIISIISLLFVPGIIKPDNRS